MQAAGHNLPYLYLVLVISDVNKLPADPALPLFISDQLAVALVKVGIGFSLHLLPYMSISCHTAWLPFNVAYC